MELLGLWGLFLVGDLDTVAADRSQYLGRSPYTGRLEQQAVSVLAEL
jgi:hypothetical protein